VGCSHSSSYRLHRQLFRRLKYASTDAFCTSCHEMDTPFQELTHSVHYSNVLGVRASCADCHVPPAFLPGLMRHMAASLEVWAHLTGELGTPAKYESHRLELAQKIWRELKANDSAECRSCHTPSAMARVRQPSTGATGAAISPQPCTNLWRPATPASTATRLSACATDRQLSGFAQIHQHRLRRSCMMVRKIGRYPMANCVLYTVPALSAGCQ